MSETYLILWSIQRDIVINVHTYPLLSSDFNQTWIFSTNFRKILKFHDYPSTGSRVVLRARTGRQNEANSRFTQFNESAWNLTNTKCKWFWRHCGKLTTRQYSSSCYLHCIGLFLINDVSLWIAFLSEIVFGVLDSTKATLPVSSSNFRIFVTHSTVIYRYTYLYIYKYIYIHK